MLACQIMAKLVLKYFFKMNKYYQIECWSELFKKWIRYNFIDYKNIKLAREEIGNFHQHKLGTKFRMLEVKIIKK
jgi:hypothetical protein